MPLIPSTSKAVAQNSDAGSSKSLTPQRKHRKLLKDGSGVEVWPEQVEKIFVQGLRTYWESPWATYSRGRSRWRNQFLVDHLQKSGIVRTKKQVASHIQVLRNMWKGQPEFHLVAGGEELFLETGLLAPVKLEDQCDPNSLFSLDDESDTVSSTSTSPAGYSPGTLKPEHLPSPIQPTSPLFTSNAYPHNPLPTRIDTSLPSPDVGSRDFSTSPLGSGSSTFVLGDQSIRRIGHAGLSHLRETNFGGPSYSSIAHSRSLDSPFHTQHSEQPFHTAVSFRADGSLPSTNRVLNMFINAEGMTPFAVKMDALVPPGQSSASSQGMALKVKLCIPPKEDAYTSPTLYGFDVTLSLASAGLNSSRCVTKVYNNTACISEESGPLELSASSSGGPIIAYLPESSLSRCRWLDASVHTNITQHVIVDNETFLYIFYELDRRVIGGLPSAELTGYQTRRTITKSPSSPSSSYSPLQNFYTSRGDYASNYGTILTNSYPPNPYRHPDQTSLSYALTPINARSQPTVATSTSARF